MNLEFVSLLNIAFHSRMTTTDTQGQVFLFGLLAISMLTVHSSLEGIHPGPGICPFQCTCVNRTMQCDNLTLFPPGIPSTIKSIIISNSFFPAVLMTELKKVENLYRFFVERSSIGKIETCAFTGNNISSIVFKDTSIDTIESHSFAQLINIGSIKFIRCSVSSIEANAFTSITESQVISFRYSNITLVNSFAFDVLGNITLFDIRYTHIKHFSVDAIRKIRDIKKVRFTKNIFEIWRCPLQSDSFANVQTIIVRDNQFVCNCNQTSMGGDAYELGENNKCHSPQNEAGMFLNQTGWMRNCNVGCQESSTRSLSFSCRYVFDNPIIPLKPFKYPRSRDTTPFSNGVRESRSVFSVFVGLTWVVFQTTPPRTL